MDQIFQVAFGAAAVIVFFWLLFRRRRLTSAAKLVSREEIIERTEKSITVDNNGWYYIEDLTANCLREIGEVEGWRGNAPRYGEYLRQWKTRVAQVPNALELSQSLGDRFRTHHEDLKLERQRKQEEERQRRFSQYREWLLSQQKALLDRFLEVAERKVSVLDDYGDEHWDALPKEIETCLLKIAKAESDIAPETLRTALKKGSVYGLPEKYVLVST